MKKAEKSCCNGEKYLTRYIPIVYGLLIYGAQFKRWMERMTWHGTCSHRNLISFFPDATPLLPKKTNNYMKLYKM
jgi:hypothetical protein